MGSIILCHSVIAKTPFEITRIHKKIYTIEELCYYITHNLYLVDNTVINEQLCTWIEGELELRELSYQLRNILLDHIGKEEFIMTLMKESKIYIQSELNHLQDVLARLKDLPDVERQKNKGDNLLKNGETEEAILVYQSILRGLRDENLEESFYGKVYACMGAAYGRMFLYKESMAMYDKAFQICNDPALVKCYLYAASRCLDETQYRLILSKSEVFEEIDEMLKTEISFVKSQVDFLPTQELLDQWKQTYRMDHVG